jgi:hypothetical protein
LGYAERTFRTYQRTSPACSINQFVRLVSVYHLKVNQVEGFKRKFSPENKVSYMQHVYVSGVCNGGYEVLKVIVTRCEWPAVFKTSGPVLH